jgi:hypothetical protein
MAVGDAIPPETLGGSRHGVLIAQPEVAVRWTPTRTRRGARRKFVETIDWLPLDPERARVPPGGEVMLVRVERGRVADQMWIRVGGDPPPDSGVREPRRRPPAAGGGEAFAARD